MHHKTDTLSNQCSVMKRDTIVSSKPFALVVLFPPLAIVAIILFPITLAVLFWLYYRGKSEGKVEQTPSASGPSSSES